MSADKKKPPKASFDDLTPDDINLFSADYRAGIKSDRQIGAEWGISHTTVRRWAKALGISRDLVLAIQQRTKSKLAQKADGNWPGELLPEGAIETNAMAILFLKQSTLPVLTGK